MKKTLLCSAVILLMLSCSNSSTTSPERANGYSHEMKTEEDSLFQQVMDGHDAAMARMGRLAGLRKQAAHRADSLASLRSSANAGKVKALRSLADSLQASENRMNAWMDGFSIDSAKDDKDRRIAYLQAEKLKVTKVKNEVLSSVAMADSLLKK